MNNNVIQALASALVNKSIISFLFNFRGVGRSQGSFSGIDEQEDVAAAMNWLASQHEVDTDKIGLAGYSFGASVALPEACRDPRVRALALISPGLIEQINIAQLREYTVPKLIISGSADEVISNEQLKLMEREAADPKRFEIISGADHSWLSLESELADKVTTFFSVLFTPDER
jgi:hypothetical protein